VFGSECPNGFLREVKRTRLDFKKKKKKKKKIARRLYVTPNGTPLRILARAEAFGVETISTKATGDRIAWSNSRFTAAVLGFRNHPAHFTGDPELAILFQRSPPGSIHRDDGRALQTTPIVAGHLGTVLR